MSNLEQYTPSEQNVNPPKPLVLAGGQGIVFERSAIESQGTINLESIRDLQIALVAALVEAAPKIQAFRDGMLALIQHSVEQAEANRQARNNPPLPLMVDYADQPEIEELRQRVQKLERKLALKKYADQDWFST